MYFLITHIVIFTLLSFTTSSESVSVCFESSYQLQCSENEIILIKNAKFGHLPELDRKYKNVPTWCTKNEKYYNLTLNNCYVDIYENIVNKCSGFKQCELNAVKSEYLKNNQTICEEISEYTPTMSVYVDYECYPADSCHAFDEIDVGEATSGCLTSVGYLSIKRKEMDWVSQIKEYYGPMKLENPIEKNARIPSKHSYTVQITILQNTIYNPASGCKPGEFLKNDYYVYILNKGLEDERRINFCESPYSVGYTTHVSNVTSISTLSNFDLSTDVFKQFLLIKVTLLLCPQITIPGARMELDHLSNPYIEKFATFECIKKDEFMLKHSSSLENKKTKFVIYCNFVTKQWKTNEYVGERCVSSFPTTTISTTTQTTTTSTITTTLKYTSTNLSRLNSSNVTTTSTTKTEVKTTGFPIILPGSISTTEKIKKATNNTLLAVLLPLFLILVFLLLLYIVMRYCFKRSFEEFVDQMRMKFRKNVSMTKYRHHDPIPLLNTDSQFSYYKSPSSLTTSSKNNPRHSITSSTTYHYHIDPATSESFLLSPCSSYRQICPRQRMNIPATFLMANLNNNANNNCFIATNADANNNNNIICRDTHKHLMNQPCMTCNQYAIIPQRSATMTTDDYPNDELPSRISRESPFQKLVRSVSNLKNNTVGRSTSGGSKQFLKDRASYLMDDNMVNSALYPPMLYSPQLYPHARPISNCSSFQNTPIAQRFSYTPHPMQHNSTVSLNSNGTLLGPLPTQFKQKPPPTSSNNNPIKFATNLEPSLTVDTYLEPNQKNEDNKDLEKKVEDPPKSSEYFFYEQNSSKPTVDGSTMTKDDSSDDSNEPPVPCNQPIKNTNQNQTANQICVPEMRNPTRPISTSNDLKRASMISNPYYGDQNLELRFNENKNNFSLPSSSMKSTSFLETINDGIYEELDQDMPPVTNTIDRRNLALPPTPDK